MKVQIESLMVQELVVLLNCAAGTLESFDSFEPDEVAALVDDLTKTAKDLTAVLKEPTP